MILSENFNIKNGVINGRTGPLKIAYIDPNDSEGTYDFKDDIKNRFGGKWLNTLRTWGWFLGDNPTEVYNTKIKPCLEFLESNARVGERRGPEKIISIIDQLISEVESTNNVAFETQDEVVRKLDSFKEQLMNAVSSEDFKRLIEPIIKFKRAQGHQFSFLNAILIMMQDPQAVLVKSKTRWSAMNRNVKPDAPKLWARVPVGNKVSVNKEEVTGRFLTAVGKTSVEELSPGEKEELSIQLHPTSAMGFKLVPCFYDYRFTEQMEGKEDLVGDPNAEVQWYDDTGEETEEMVAYVEAMKRIIMKSGIRITYVDDLGGARGMSCGGEIKLLSNDAKNSGLLNTEIHEFAHEILHQKYLKKRGQSWADYFVGTEQGREIVEQQAELTAWIVLMFLGYNLQTNINYMGIWGISQENTKNVFDSVAGLANEIHSRLVKEVANGDNDFGFNSERDENPTTLSEDTVSEVKSITGRELAYMVGLGKLYDKCAKKEINTIKESFNKTLNRITNPIIY